MPAKKSNQGGGGRRRAGGPRPGGDEHVADLPTRERLQDVLAEIGAPADLDEIANLAGVEEGKSLKALERRLEAMVQDGVIIRNRRGKYCLVERTSLVIGRVQGHPDGFGFLVPDAGGDDLFLAPRQMRELMHGDRAACRVKGKDFRGRSEGSLVRVLERNALVQVGRFHLEHNLGFVAPDNPRQTQDILVPGRNRGKAKDGQVVEVEITDPPTRHSQPIGKVTRILGEADDPGIEVDIAISAYDLPDAFPEAVTEEAERFGDRVPAEVAKEREDLRDMPLVTIDGADAKDFDDAVFAEPVGDGWRLVVAIADVSYYVRPGSALDEEAKERGNSVYFPDRVVPMLPEALSNGLCSLNPDVDRLAMVCDMRLDAKGRVTNSRFYDAVIRSHGRLIYEQVAAALDGDKDTRAALGPLVTRIEALADLFRVLFAARRRRGALEMDSHESRFVFSDDGRVEAIVPTERNDAHRIIEECMITANVQAASFLENHEVVNLYRVHDRPPEEKVADLREALAGFGIALPARDLPSPKDFARVLEEAQERPERKLIQTMVLRSLAQAVYSADNLGHFGLALERYSHFTSPIRRYPDLLVHRGIRHIIEGRRGGDFLYGKSQMEHLGQHCSTTERRADEATRDVESALKCDFMAERVGEEFDAHITGVKDFGIFVALDSNAVEGLVHVSNMGRDYYRYVPEKHALFGDNTEARFRLGDPVRVRLVDVRGEERKIDFELAGDALPAEPPAKPPAKPSAKSGGGKPRKGRRRKR